MNRVPLDLAAHAVGVQPATIRQWVHRGKLIRHDDGYDLLELLAASDSRDLDALLSRAGVKINERAACHLRAP